MTEETTHPLAAPHAAVLRLNLQAGDHLVAKPLMVALAIIMDHEIGERAPCPKGVVADEHKALL